MGDLTVLFITASKLPEAWTAYHRDRLWEAAWGFPIISVSRKPLDVGTNVVESEPVGISNIYRQMLVAAKMAETKYVAVAEDDVLYTEDHFKNFRPPPDAFAYNMNHWSLFTWGEPMYSYRYRMTNSMLVAPTALVVEALEERFAKHPDGTPERYTGELGRLEKLLGLTRRKAVMFESSYAAIIFNHDFSSEDFQRRHVKRPGQPRALEIPHWGRAEELVKRFA